MPRTNAVRRKVVLTLQATKVMQTVAFYEKQ
jgi:hypothetical protein